MSSPLPPTLAVKLLSASLSRHLREPVLGDLEEAFLMKVEQASLAKARCWYWRQALISSVHFIKTKESHMSKRTKIVLWVCTSLTIFITLFYLNMEPYQKERLANAISVLLNS